MKQGGQVLNSQYILTPNSICRDCVLCLSETIENLCYTVRQDMARWILCQSSLGLWKMVSFQHTHNDPDYTSNQRTTTWGHPRSERLNFYCVCVWEADRQRDIFIRNCLKIPRRVVDKLATLQVWWYSFSLKARRWRHGRPNVLIEFERRKKKSVPSWRQLGRRNSLLSP